MGKKWSMVIKENPVLAARIAAHQKRRAALEAQTEAEPSASEGADKGEDATPEKHSHAETRSGLEVRPDRAQKVYFFGTSDGSRIKIGYTSDLLPKRKQSILNGQLNDLDLLLLAAVPGTRTHEQHLHKHFNHLRIAGNSKESYEPKPELVEYVNWLRQQYWIYLDEDDKVDVTPSFNEWMPRPDRRVGFMEEDPFDLIPRHRTYCGPLAGTPWNKLSTPSPAAGDDYYTDPKIIDAAREAMGGIDLDAASHWFANKRHKIPRYFHLGRSAFDNQWCGDDGEAVNVWLNPPYGDNAPWLEAIKKAHNSGYIKQLCMISPVWAFTTAMALPIMALTSAMVLLTPTPSFWGNPTGKTGTNHPHAVIYIGENADRFLSAFASLGIRIWTQKP